MANKEYIAYIGTDSVRGSKGVYCIGIDSETGALTVKGAAAAHDPGYLAIAGDGKTLYGTIEGMHYMGKARAGVCSFHIDEDGLPVPLNQKPTEGQLAAHLCVDDERKKIYVASYMGGCINVFALEEDGSIGELLEVVGHDKEGKQCPQVHCVMMTPDKKYLCAAECGTGKIYLYALDGEKLEKAFMLEAGPVRPRHFKFSADGKYLYNITEGSHEIYVFAYQPDRPEMLKKIQGCFTAAPDALVFPAAIKLTPDGSLLMGSNRGPFDNSLAIFGVDKETGLLTEAGAYDLPGIEPRDFSFTPDGKYAIVGHQSSDTICSFLVDYENKTLIPTGFSAAVPAPTCVLIADLQ